MTEVWKPVVGFEDRYEVSNLGNVRSFIIPVRGGVRRAPPRLRAKLIDRDGYERIRLYRDRKLKDVLISRIVLTAFVGKPFAKADAAHLNGRRDDNRLENLKWVSRQENEGHKKIHGTSPKGSRNPASILNESQVVEIVELLRNGGKTQVEIAKMFGVGAVAINNIKTGRNWAHLTRINQIIFR